jgi:hypothetical protein
MIQMISGFTCFKGRLISPKDGFVVLDEDAEACLVAAKVAEYPAAAPQGAPADNFSAEQGADPAYAENAAEDAIAGAAALDEPQEPALESMTMAELKELAEGMGISVKGMRSKAAVIAAIEAEAKPPDPKVME